MCPFLLFSVYATTHRGRLGKSFSHFGTWNRTVTERVTLHDFMERNETERGVQVWITERNAFHSYCNDLHHCPTQFKSTLFFPCWELLQYILSPFGEISV